MKARVSTFAFAVAMAAIACKDDKPAPPATTASTTEITTSSAVASAAPSSSEHRGHRSCPSRVRGATVTASDVDRGVMLSVTASDDTTVGEIQSRASALSSTPEGRRGRFCPEMEEGTTRSVKTTPKGVEITLVPTNASDLAHVRTDVREHLAHGEKRPD